jgi:hypothetical protein
MPRTYEDCRVILTKLDGFGGFCCRYLIRLQSQENRCIEQPEFGVFRESLYGLVRKPRCPIRITS